MTPILDGSSDESERETYYPTDWRIANELSCTEVREVSQGMYELRTLTSQVVVPSEGFNAWRTSQETFEKWLRAHTDYEVEQRTDNGR